MSEFRIMLCGVFLLLLSPMQDAQSIGDLMEPPFDFILTKRVVTETYEYIVELELSVLRPTSDAAEERIVYYGEERKVVWSLEDEVVEIDAWNEHSVSRSRLETFLENVKSAFRSVEANIDPLDDPFAPLLPNRWFGFVHKYQSGSVDIDESLVGMILDFLAGTGVNAPQEPKDIRIMFGVNDQIQVLSDEALNDRHLYAQAKIVEIEELPAVRDGEERVRIAFEGTTSNLPSIEGLVTFARPSLSELAGREVWWVETNYERDVSDGDSLEPVDATVEELLNQPDVFHGKRVKVSGYFSDGFEAQHLYGKFGQHDRFLWLGELSPISGRWTRKRGGKVTVEGIFLTGPSGHFGMSPGEITRITSLRGVFWRDLLYGGLVVFLLCSGTVVFVFWRRTKKNASSS